MKSLLLAMMAIVFVACTSTPEKRAPDSLPDPRKEESKEPSNSTVPIKKQKDLFAYYVTVAKTAQTKVASNGSDQDWRSRCEDWQPVSCMKTVCAQGGYNCQARSHLEEVVQLCKESDGRCVQEVCKQGGYNCQARSHLEDVVKMCKESRGSCVKAVCKQGGYNCQARSHLESVVELCQKANGPCIEDICSQGGYNCQARSHLEDVIKMCN